MAGGGMLFFGKLGRVTDAAGTLFRKIFVGS